MSREIIGIMLSAKFFYKVSFATKINPFLRQKSEAGKYLGAFVRNFWKSLRLTLHNEYGFIHSSNVYHISESNYIK